MARLRWGVLSTARIGVHKVIPGMQRGERCEVVAIASRDLQRAQATARQLGIPRAHGSYEALLADPEVDAVYNPLPNHLHVPWSLEALKAGKHVLCEKPIGLTSDEGRKLLAASQARPELKVMEAFMYRHHPQWRLAQQIVRDGELGPLRTIQSFFSYFNDDPCDIRNQAEIGGGGLMDIGCYPISLSRFIFGREPARVLGIVEFDDRFHTDRLASAILDFGDATATFTCSTQLAPHQRAQLFGERGRVEIEIPFNAPPDRPCVLWKQIGAELERIELPICDQYTAQGDLFAAAVLEGGEVPTPLIDAIQNMLVIEALFRSAKSGAWERVAG